MKRFSGTELAALALAAVLFLGGASLVIWPQSGSVPHEGTNPYARNLNALDSLSEPKSRLLGVIGMAFGAGLGAIIYRGKS